MKTFKDYLKASRKLEGWLDTDAARVIDYCNLLQEKAGITGNICEIGVHHGRTTVLLGTFIKPEKERLIVNDIFDLQQFNISVSGYGSEKIFLRNLTDFFETLDFLTVIKKPSSELTVEETTGDCRIFVIDGGHTAEETLTDMRTAFRALGEKGIIIIDDYFTFEFPGVSEGVCRFLFEEEGLVPWIYCFKQMLLIKKAAVEFYEDLLEKHDFDSFCRAHRFVIQRKLFFGQNIRVLRKPNRLQYLIHLVEMKARRRPDLFNRIKGSPGFSWLRTLYQKFYTPK